MPLCTCRKLTHLQVSGQAIQAVISSGVSLLLLTLVEPAQGHVNNDRSQHQVDKTE